MHLVGDDDKIPPALVDEKDENEDGEWEDVPVDDATFVRSDSDSKASSATRVNARSRSGTPAFPRRTTATGRRRVGRPTSMPQTATTVPLHLRRPQKLKEPMIALDTEQAVRVMLRGVAESVRYLGAVVTHAFQLLRKPLGFLVFLWLLGTILAQLSNTFRAALAPVCWIPLVSRLPICKPPSEAQWADYPGLVEIQSTNFEQLLDGAVGGSSLSLEIKKAEMATKDLITLVKVSDLKSRDLLAQSLYEFVEDAKTTGKSLHTLTAKINGAVDTIMALNDHALHTIESAQNQQGAASPSRALIRALWPFGSIGPGGPTPAPPRAVLVDQFRASLDAHEAATRRLVLALHASAGHLDRLEAHLDTLHELCARENLTLVAARDALLAELWTALGGNRAQLRAFGTNLALLRDVGEYRRRAAAHVAAAMQTLQAMGEDMEDLRERVAAPEIMGERIPIEVHMKSIKAGMERLQEQRVQARDREVALVNKMLGIED